MQDLQIGQRFVSLLLYNCDTGKSQSAKWVENLGVYIFETHPALRSFGASPFVFLYDINIDLIKSDKNSLFGSEGWQERRQHSDSNVITHNNH